MVNQIVDEQGARERECVHRREGTEGTFYEGQQYVESLQRLRSSAAMSIASKVTPFFWADARSIKVWLCRACASEAGF